MTQKCVPIFSVGIYIERESGQIGLYHSAHMVLQTCVHTMLMLELRQHCGPVRKFKARNEE